MLAASSCPAPNTLPSPSARALPTCYRDSGAAGGLTFYSALAAWRFAGRPRRARGSPKTAEPATNRVAPASATEPTVSASIPPSTSIIWRGRERPRASRPCPGRRR